MRRTTTLWMIITFLGFAGMVFFLKEIHNPKVVEASDIAQEWMPPSTTGSHLRMRRLWPDGTSKAEDCVAGDRSYGCTAFCEDVPDKCASPVRPYPYSSAWPNISFDRDYLLDVVGQEASPGLFDPVALQAQAIAARSYAWYQINNAPGNVINNSTSFQVFLPFKFETFGPDPNNVGDPCQSTNLSANQTRLCQAVGTAGYYLSWDDATNPQYLPARANFFGDALERTTSSGDKAYLIGVEDPISNNNATCSARNSAAHSWGMSQEGAQRWATGDQCGTTYPNIDALWSVRWTRPEQILFHYYTDMHIRDSNKQVVATMSSANRWNPLQVTGVLAQGAPILWRGANFPTGVLVQNTGLSDWLCTSEVLGYRLRYRWAKPGRAPLDGQQSPRMCGVAQGSATWTAVSVDHIPDWGFGYYTVQFDIIKESTSGAERFSPAWSTYNIVAFVLPTSLWGGYTSPAAGTGVNYSVNLTAQAGGDGNSAGVDRVLFRANVGGGGWQAVAADDTDCPIGQTCTYNATWNVVGIPNQTPITLGFDVVDHTGTTYPSPQGTREIVIHDEPPTITLATANGDSDSLIWSNQRQWTFAGTASDPEGRLGALAFHCSGDYCGALVSQTGGSNWTHVQRELLGQVEVYFSVSDPALNVATSRRLDLRIDVAAPTTTALLNGASPGAWYSGTVQVQLAAADNGSGRAVSGVTGITYRANEQPVQFHAGDVVTFPVSGEGSHTLAFHARDIVGNHEPTRTVSFGIDETAPVAQDVTVAPGSGLGNCSVPTGTVWLALSAADEGSGVQAMRLSNDGVSWSAWRAYARRALWQMANVSAPSAVYFQVRDGVGWLSAPISRTLVYAPADVWCTYLPTVQRQ